MNISNNKGLILGWSISRYDKFVSCKRKYFYDYYSKFDLEIPLKKIQFLKSLTSKSLEIGNIVHTIIKTIFERYQINNKPLNIIKLFEYSFNIIKTNCATKTFFETYYHNEKIMIDEIYTKVKICLDNFLNSNRFKGIINNRLIMAQKDKWIIEPKGYGEATINNYKIFCKVDFLFYFNNRLYIIDWKTGKQIKAKHEKQLMVYSLWAHILLKKQVRNIIPIVVYLAPQYDEKIIITTKNNVSKLLKNIEDETNNMYKYLINVKNNIPKPKDDFSLTTNIFCCKYCNYKEICF